MRSQKLDWRGERGQVLILTALSFTVLLGVAALTIDGGFMYDKRNKLYQAADLAAKSGAIEYRLNNAVSQGELENFADRAFNTHSFVTTRQTGGNVTVTVTHPPDDGPYSGNMDYVEVEAAQPNATFFAAMMGFATVTPKVRAVAGAGASSDCIVLLNPPSGDLTITNPVGYINGPSCSITTGGDIENDGTLNVGSISGASCDGCSGNFHQTTIPPSDPLAHLVPPTPAQCNNGNPGTVSGPAILSGNDLEINNGGNVTIGPGTYGEIEIDLDTTSWLILTAGIYCITGEMHPRTPGQDVRIDASAGVFIYMAAPDGEFNLDGNQVDMNWNAPTGGPYDGIMFFQDRNNTNTVTLTKNHGPYNVNGAFYAPSATIDGKNANWAPTNFCGLMVGGAMDFDKPTLDMNSSCFDFGTIFETISLAE